VTLPRGEDVVDQFIKWEKAGRIDQWSILVEFVGRAGGPRQCRLKAAPLGVVVPGLVNGVILRDALENWDRRAAISVRGANESYVILSPKGAT
jgi:hypothetical protein